MLALAPRTHAGLIGDDVHATFFYYPDLSTVDSDAGSFIADNNTATFSGDHYGTYMSATFNAHQIILIDLGPGIDAEADFIGLDVSLLSGAPFTSVALNPHSSPWFAPGSVLSWSGDDIKIDLGDTFPECLGGEIIKLDVMTAAVPEPASMALCGAGLAVLAWRRRQTLRTTE